MKKHKLLLIALLITFLTATTGCVRGEITLDIARTGAAQLSTKILVINFLKDSLTDLKNKFTQDKFEVMDVKESNFEGFVATRKFSNISQMKDVQVFKGLNLQETLNKKPTPTNGTGADSSLPAKKDPVLIVERGLLFDKYKVDVNVDLGSKYSNNTKKEENIFAKQLLSQIDLKFILKLPTSTTKNNAHQVSQDGKTLTWQLALGENNQVVAEAEMLNMITVGVVLGILVGGTIIFVFYRRRRTKGV